MKLFSGYQYYPIIDLGGKKAIETEYGRIQLSDYETRCHQCHKPLAYKVEREDTPKMCRIMDNWFQPYFYYLSGDCFHNLHGGFGRPAQIMKKGVKQTSIEEWF